MILETLELKNFRLHRDITFKFTTGVNGIVGDNGKGKSSIIAALQFLYTGELDDKKEDVVTLGQSIGWVSGTFSMSGKKGTLKRWLNESKVVLEFDGKKYNKSADVKELWSQLLQIDNHIFKNVIVAHQKEIPFLFSGDGSEREKIFQKIFLVPNTTKARSIIWDKYIKTAPLEAPMLTEEQMAQKTDQILLLRDAAGLTLLSIEQERKQLLDNKSLEEVRDRIHFLKAVILRREERVQKTQAVVDCDDRINLLTPKVLALADSLKQLDPDTFRTLLVDQEKKRALKVMKNQLDKKIKDLGGIATNEQIDELETIAANTMDIYGEHLQESNVLQAQLETLDSEIKKHGTLGGTPTCPTCGQSIADLVAVISKLKADRTELFSKLAVARKQADSSKTTALTARATWEAADKKFKQFNELTEQLKQYGDVEVDEEQISLCKEVLAKYDQDMGELNKLTTNLAVEKQKLAGLLDSVNSIPVYDGNPEEEIPELEKVIATNEAVVQWIAKLEKEVEMNEFKIGQLEADLSNDVAVRAKNLKRKAYVDILTKVYDLLHPSQFPRKLIMSYAGIVEEELTKYLQKFTIPYTARVNENFKIEVLNQDNLILPSVSGGQEMIIGLCLRVALHTLFSQSFPLLIIDEGTTHLDKDNRALYFDMIKNLKAETNINQIIVIDHDSGLLDVVDNTIQL